MLRPLKKLLKKCGFKTTLRIDAEYTPNSLAGCSLSHHNALHEVDPPFIVFEDDCVIKNFQPEIEIPEGVTNINISADGIVSVQNPGEVEAEEVGQFQLADFANVRGLQPIGQSMLVETPASGPAVIANPFENGFGSLVQGALESSNVNVVQQLVDMIETQRAYEVSSKSITAVDEMMQFISRNL